MSAREVYRSRGFTIHVQYSDFICCEFFMVSALTTGEVNAYSFLSMSAVLPVSSYFSFSTDSDQKASSLPIDTSPDVLPVGCFVPAVKNKENLRLERKRNRAVISVAICILMSTQFCRNNSLS